MMVSPETRNSSIRMYQGPTDRRPAAASARQPCVGLGPHLEVVVDHRQLAVEQEVARRTGRVHQVEQVVDQADQLRRKVWKGSYHSRSQWVWGTTRSPWPAPDLWWPIRRRPGLPRRSRADRPYSAS